MVLEQFNQFGESSYDVALSMMNEIKKNIGRWAARVPGAEYAGQGKDSLEKVIKIFEEKIVPAMQDPEMEKCFQDDGSNAQKAFGIAVKTMQNFLAIDNLVKQNRVRLFSDFVSKNLAEEFTEYYNTVSGMDDVVVTIDDLSDPSKIPAYVKNEYAIISATSPDEPKWHLRVIDIYKKYGLEAPFTADTYMEIMKEFIKRDISREMSQVEMKGVLAFEPLEEVILSWEGKMTEENNLPKYLDFIKSIGYSSSDYGKVIGTKGKKLPKSFI